MNANIDAYHQVRPLEAYHIQYVFSRSQTQVPEVVFHFAGHTSVVPLAVPGKYCDDRLFQSRLFDLMGITMTEQAMSVGTGAVFVDKIVEDCIEALEKEDLEKTEMVVENEGVDLDNEQS